MILTLGLSHVICWRHYILICVTVVIFRVNVRREKSGLIPIDLRVIVSFVMCSMGRGYIVRRMVGGRKIDQTFLRVYKFSELKLWECFYSCLDAMGIVRKDVCCSFSYQCMKGPHRTCSTREPQTYRKVEFVVSSFGQLLFFWQKAVFWISVMRSGSDLANN